MVKKLFRLFCTMLMVGLLVNTYALAASPTENSGPKPLTPQLSTDGNTMYYGMKQVPYVVDPNPPANQVNIPAPFELSTIPEKAISTFSITYIPAGSKDLDNVTCLAFPAQAQTVFNAAVAIWGNLVQSSVPITIKACWANLGSPTTLGYSGGGTLHRNFTGAPLANTWYGAALANSKAGSDLDPSNHDMHITYNNGFSWYYGTDANPTADTYDLLTVVLHEIAHGLNFSGSARYSGGSGSWGYSTGNPNIYDTFMKDGSGTALTTYTNPSTALGNLLISNNLWFHGSNAMTGNGGSKVKMDAQSTWASGSSYSHLDYATFSGTVHRMMVRSIASATATHDPQTVTKGLLKDLGWTVGGGAVPAAPSGLGASTVSATAITLNWTDNATNETGFKVEMKTGAGGSYSQLGTVNAGATGANITGLTEGTTYYYRVRAYNANGDSAYSNEANATTLLAAPSGLGASSASATTISLSWTDNAANETGFKVESKIGASGTYSQIGTVIAGTTGANITGLTEGTTYYYRVRAYNANGDSAYSNEANATTLPAAPSGLSASSASATTINLIWTVNSSSETGFKVESKIGASGTYSQINTVSAGATGATVTGLTTGTTYYYRVRAYIGALNSDYSNEANATPVVPSAGGGGGGGGCFIATAAFGTPLEKHVQILREFRDRCLLTSSAGQAFVKFYYEVSPPIAGKIAQSEGLRFITRGSLMPFVGMAYLMVTYGATATLLLALSLMLMVGAVVWIIRRKMMMVNP